MKRIACLTVLAVILVAAVTAAAGPALMNMRLHQGKPTAGQHPYPAQVRLPGWHPG